ncbi:hypothetical protein BST86_11810 [Nonlabens agnitus]|uniref:Uncharacterized protein n=1 Tax=Nonlabens agnitus TaxID=870484 RepID=A0A2S9WW75_9FLAO|nr:hypothetical protein BST86_11810 [Nonlabens agnitus]
MLIQFYILVTAILLQGSADSPPVPKNLAPPVGDPVPIDESILVLVLVAICIGIWHLYSSRVKDFKRN